MTQLTPAQPDCTLCELHLLAANPGVPSRPADLMSPSRPQASRCLFVLGMNPGHNEDRTNRCWVGRSGHLINSYLSGYLELQDNDCDAYLGNVCRCRAPKVNIKPRRACFAHLRADLIALTNAYGEGNVHILAMGAEACWACTGQGSVKKSVAYQGIARHLRIWADDKSTGDERAAGYIFRCFYTYHPAATLPGRDPSLLQPMQDHFRYLRDYLSGAITYPTLPTPYTQAADHIDDLAAGSPVGLDIETYGILGGNDQTVFHPRKMIEIDGKLRDQLVVSVAIAYKSTSGNLNSSVYRWADRSHRAAFRRLLLSLPLGTILLGQNIPFDITVLHFASLDLGTILTPDRFRLDDTAVTNHLDSDVRPERSQKDQARLFRTADYESSAVNARAGLQARSDRDPNLYLYNALDAVTVLRNRDLHLANILDRHGPSHPALQPSGIQFRSDLLWTVIHMTEAGVAFDRAAVLRAHEKLIDKTVDIAERLYKHDIIACGKGSDASKRRFFEAVATAFDLLGHPDLKKTEKHNLVSIGVDNVNFLMSSVPISHPLREPLKLLDDHTHASKIITSYTKKLLGLVPKRLSSRILSNGCAYPSWYPVPSYVKDSSGGEGGTRQGRLSARNPGAQTFPPIIKACRWSRYGASYGILADYDESQMELRTAGLMSGDPAMMAAYSDPDADIHLDTARSPGLWPSLTKDDPEFKMKRQLGKVANFLMIYRGGPNALVAQCRRKGGIEVAYEVAKALIDATRLRFAVLAAWQEEWIERCARDGYMVLPLTGWKRTFLGGSKSIVAESYSNNIANYPIQTTAAQILLSAQAAILRDRHSLNLTFVMPQQDHDSLTIDTMRSCFYAVNAIVTEHLTHPPLWSALEDHYGRHMPLRVDRNIIYPTKESSHE